jgi:hypothetical protein
VKAEFHVLSTIFMKYEEDTLMIQDRITKKEKKLFNKDIFDKFW